jgi:hypothetical protein
MIPNLIDSWNARNYFHYNDMGSMFETNWFVSFEKEDFQQVHGIDAQPEFWWICVTTGI